MKVKKEYELSVKADHPNCVRIKELIKIDYPKQICMIMPHYKLNNLKTFIHRNKDGLNEL